MTSKKMKKKWFGTSTKETFPTKGKTVWEGGGEIMAHRLCASGKYSSIVYKRPALKMKFLLAV